MKASAAATGAILHRDLKPDNIMLVADSEVAGGERAKVLDFGLAKLLVSHQGVKTRTGSFFGTPTYMSPEQCGRKAPVGEKSDVYALGATLFEMLAGRPPFLGDEPNQLLGQHLFSMPPALDEQVSGVPPAVASLVRRMLAKSPTERPTMSEVAAELDSFSISVQLPAGGLLLPSSKASRPSDAFQPTINAGMDGLAAEFAAAQAKQQPASALSAPLPKVRKRRRLLPSLLTLSRATGQFRSAHPVSISAVLGALALAALVVVSTRLYRQQSRASTVPVVQTADALRKVQWSLDSNPAGAQVFRLVDGQVLGQTPWLSVQDAAPGEVAVLLRLSGFKDVVLTLDRSASVARLERLVPLPAPVVSPSVDAVPVPPPKPAKRSHRRQADVDLQPVR